MNGASKLTHLLCLRMYVSASCRKTSIAGSLLVSQSGEPWIHTLSAARPDAPAGVAATTDEATTNSHFLMWGFPFFRQLDDLLGRPRFTINASLQSEVGDIHHERSRVGAPAFDQVAGNPDFLANEFSVPRNFLRIEGELKPRYKPVLSKTGGR